MVHGVSPLLIEILAGINQQDTPPPLSPHTPEITITLERGLDGELDEGTKIFFRLDVFGQLSWPVF